MKLFGRKKKKQDILSVSGKQLCAMLKKAVGLLKEDVNAKCYVTGPEIMFEYKGNIHFAGLRYDKQRAKADGHAEFSKRFLSTYLDHKTYQTIDLLYENVSVDGVLLKRITDGIIVYPEYNKLSE